MPDFILIADPDDPRVEPYRDLRDRDLARVHASFIAEGKVVLNALFQAGRFRPLSALILENRFEGMRETLAAAPTAMPVYVASQAVLDRIAGFHLHRGVLAHVARRDPISLDNLLGSLPEKALIVAAIGIANHDNVGAIFRNAAAFEADAVLLDETCCDPLYRKAIRVSVGAAVTVPFTHGGTAETLVDALSRYGFQPIALSPSGRTDIATVPQVDRRALLLGTEGEGLPKAILDGIETVRIAMSETFDSLNVAAASAIALHRLGRFRS